MSSGIPLEISHLIRELRQQLGLSQEQMAAQIGVSFRTINRWENGRVKPLPIALKQIKYLLYQMGDAGKDLLMKYFSE